MIGHLGTRVSALLDGQLSAEETERAWDHVHGCHVCRDLVERQGWVKTRLAGLAYDDSVSSASDRLKCSLLGAMSVPQDDPYLVMGVPDQRRRTAGLVAIGGGAVGAAVVGVLAFGVAPADAPSRPAPASITRSEAPRLPAPSESVSWRMTPAGSRQR